MSLVANLLNSFHCAPFLHSINSTNNTKQHHLSFVLLYTLSSCVALPAMAGLYTILVFATLLSVAYVAILPNQYHLISNKFAVSLLFFTTVGTYITYHVLIYPFFFSPLRHLPEPKVFPSCFFCHSACSPCSPSLLHIFPYITTPFCLFHHHGHFLPAPSLHPPSSLLRLGDVC